MAKRRIPFGWTPNERWILVALSIVGMAFLFRSTLFGSIRGLAGALILVAALTWTLCRFADWIRRNRQSVCYTLSQNGELITVENSDAAEDVIEVFAGRRSALHIRSCNCEWRIIDDDGEEYPRLWLADNQSGYVRVSLDDAFKVVRFYGVASAIEAGLRATVELKEKEANLAESMRYGDVILRDCRAEREMFVNTVAKAIAGNELIVERISAGKIKAVSAARKELQFLLQCVLPLPSGDPLASRMLDARTAVEQVFAARDEERRHVKAKAAAETSS